jgi:hypothetical protein
MWKKQSIFLELPYWKWLDVRHSIDVMHVEMNVHESFLGTLLNTDRKTRDHGHAWANSVKGMKLPTSFIIILKNEKEFCGFLKNVKIPSGYLMNVSRLISLLDLKVAPNVKSHDYHILLTQMIAIRIQNILPVNVREAIMNFFFFFNAIGQKVLSDEALKSLEKSTMKLYVF